MAPRKRSPADNQSVQAVVKRPRTSTKVARDDGSTSSEHTVASDSSNSSKKMEEDAANDETEPGNVTSAEELDDRITSTEEPVADSVSDTGPLAEYDDHLKRRLLNLLNYQNESTNTYSIDKIPSTVGWGVNRPFDNKIKVLCKYSTNEPVILWVVGKVSKYWFANSKGEPAAQVNVHVVPLTDGAGRRARTIISSLSKPSEPSTEDGWADVRATKWQNEGLGGQSGGDPYPFSAVFDARIALRAKSDMQTYSALDIKQRDVVLMEVQVGRYRIKDEVEKKPLSPSKVVTFNRAKVLTWDRWRAQYELRSLSLLAKAEHRDDDEEKECEDLCI